MIIIKIGTPDCVNCRKLNLEWSSIIGAYKEHKFLSIDPLKDNKIVQELIKENISTMPIIKIQDGDNVIYKTGILTKKQFDEFMRGESVRKIKKS